MWHIPTPHHLILSICSFYQHGELSFGNLTFGALMKIKHQEKMPLLITIIKSPYFHFGPKYKKESLLKKYVANEQIKQFVSYSYLQPNYNVQITKWCQQHNKSKKVVDEKPVKEKV